MGTKIVLRCPCQAKVPVESAESGQTLECPRCGRTLRVPDGIGTPSTSAPAAPPAPGSDDAKPAAPADVDTAQVVAPKVPPPATPSRWRRRSLWLLLALLLLLIPCAVMYVVLSRSGSEEPIPEVLAKARTETEKVVLDFLVAVKEARKQGVEPAVKLANKQRADQLALVPERPTARFIQAVKQTGQPAVMTDSMAAVTEFHASLDTYTRSPNGNFYTQGMDTGPVAKWYKKAKEANKAGKNMANPDLYKMDLNDKAFDRGAAVAEDLVKLLKEGTTAITDTTHTYKELLEKTTVELSPAQRRLCELYGDEIKKWRAFLGHDLANDIRPKLDPDAPFSLFHAEVIATLSDTPSMSQGVRRYKFILRRFQVEGLNTGWKIWSIEPVVGNPAAEDDSEDE